MAVHQTRRSAPLPTDIEFASLDSTSSGFSLIESAFSSPTSSPGSIEIVPLVKLGLIHGLDGPHVSYGPFTPPNKTSVPLWLAIHLKKKRKCRIISPKWLAAHYLEGILKEEQSSDEFSDLPRDYLEVSKILLDSASDDLPTPEKLRLLLKDIREARQSKIRSGLSAVNSVHLGMPNISTMEINELKPFFSGAFKRLMVLDPKAEELGERERRWMKDPEGVEEEVRMGLGREEREETFGY
ncbi:hypothetical protein JCM5353_003640 [Sporobolomyces roseus]